MYVIKVPLGVRSYTISIGDRLLGRLGHECKRLYLGQRCAVITDRNVAPHYGEAALQSLKASGFDPVLITVPAGETAKSLRVAASCYDQLSGHRLERKSFVVALGGGAGVAADEVALQPLQQADAGLGLGAADARRRGQVGHAQRLVEVAAGQPPLADDQRGVARPEEAGGVGRNCSGDWNR